MSPVSAKELKTRGVSVIEAALASSSEAVISVRGKNRYVVMSIEQYKYLRECELEAALARTKEELAQGQFIESTPEEHLERLEKDLPSS